MSSKEKCPIIFLDMDGVIADFIKAALQVHFNEKWREVLEAWPKGVYETYGHMGITEVQFWDKINEGGADFWANIPEFPWTYDLIEMCREYGKVCILSSPSRNPDCAQGKLRWVKRVFGEKFRDYVFAPKQHKKLVAAPDRYLIEDSERNAEDFVAAGGGGVVIIPQPWNKHAATSVPMVDHVRAKLESLLCTVVDSATGVIAAGKPRRNPRRMPLAYRRGTLSGSLGRDQPDTNSTRAAGRRATTGYLQVP